MRSIDRSGLGAVVGEGVLGMSIMLGVAGVPFGPSSPAAPADYVTQSSKTAWTVIALILTSFGYSWLRVTE